jgi:hypothetical protein
MCGIVGFFSVERPISPELIARSTQSLRHRGPNAQRQWLAPSGRVGLGHARLAIIDLDTGAQPIANEDEQLHVVVNGEFYVSGSAERVLELAGQAQRGVATAGIPEGVGESGQVRGRASRRSDCRVAPRDAEPSYVHLRAAKFAATWRRVGRSRQ